MSDADADYLPLSHLIERYQVTARSLERWAPDGLVRTHPNPLWKGATLYHRGNVERLS